MKHPKSMSKIDQLLREFAFWKKREWQTIQEAKLVKEAMMFAFKAGYECRDADAIKPEPK